MKPCRFSNVSKMMWKLSRTYLSVLLMTKGEFCMILDIKMTFLVFQKLDLPILAWILSKFVRMFWSLESLLKIVYLHVATGGNMSGTAVLILACLTALLLGRRPQLSQLPGGSKFSVVKMIKVIWSPNRVVTCQCHNLHKWGKFSLSPGLLLLLIWATSLDFLINL